jgi:hypothetical protein
MAALGRARGIAGPARLQTNFQLAWAPTTTRGSSQIRVSGRAARLIQPEQAATDPTLSLNLHHAKSSSRRHCPSKALLPTSTARSCQPRLTAPSTVQDESQSATASVHPRGACFTLVWIHARKHSHLDACWGIVGPPALK